MLVGVVLGQQPVEDEPARLGEAGLGAVQPEEAALQQVGQGVGEAGASDPGAADAERGEGGGVLAVAVLPDRVDGDDFILW